VIGQGGSGTVIKAQIGVGQFCYKNGATNKAVSISAEFESPSGLC
jgi:hypothetical protein